MRHLRVLQWYCLRTRLFWDVKSCRLLNTHRLFDRSCRLTSGEDEGTTIPRHVAIYQSTWRNLLPHTPSWRGPKQKLTYYHGVQTVFYTPTYKTTTAEMIVYERHCKAAVRKSRCRDNYEVRYSNFQLKPFFVFDRQELTTAFNEANYHQLTTHSNSKCYQKMLLRRTTDHADCK